MKLSRKRLVIIFMTAVLVLPTVVIFSKSNRMELESKEEPFQSLKLPLKEINATVLLGFGDQIAGPKVVIMRVVESNNKEWFIAALKYADAGSFESVLINPKIEWVEGRGLYSTLSIDELFERKNEFTSFGDTDAAVSDMIRLLEDRGNGLSEHMVVLEHLKGKR